MASNDEQAAFWEELAPSWHAAEVHHERVAEPFGRAAMAALDLAPGDRVLDLGCGAGLTTLALAEAVGPEGEVLGVDIAAAMLDPARAAAEARGLRTVRFEVADAQDADLGQGSFDAAFSRFGVMFFSDPPRAFANIRRALRPGGRLGFSCWDDLFANEWMFVPGSAVVAVTGQLPPMPGPGEPGPFSLSDPDHVLSLLEGAGFHDVTVAPVTRSLISPAEGIDAAVELSRRVGPVREALREADEDTAASLLAAVRAALEAKVVDGELRLSASALVVTARA